MNRATPSRLAPLRASLPIALLAATAALAGGAQAIAPAPAAAMVNEGEECDPLTTIDCEPTNGGGGGGPVGTTTGGGAGNGEIVGEAIYVEGTLPPSPCRASTCLPSQIGGGSTGFLDRGGRSARAPHPHGRPTRVGEVAKPKPKALTKAECEGLKSGQLVLPAEAKSRELSARELRLWKETAILRNRRNEANSEYWLKVRELQRVAGAASSDSDLKLRREGEISTEIAALKQKVESLDREETVVEERYLAVVSQRQSADDLASTEKKGQLKKCAELYGGKR